MRRPKVCSTPGCIGNALRDGKCPEHAEAAWARSQRRPKVSDRYQRNRRVALRSTRSRCAFCGRPTTTVDHRQPVAFNGSDDLSNLQPICEDHHREKTAQESVLGKLLARGDAGPAEVAAHVERWTPAVARYHKLGNSTYSDLR